MERSLSDPHRDDAPQSGRQRPLIQRAPRLAAALPSPAAPLIGREQELASLAAMLRDGARLVNLTGPGGVGKTRLALALAAVRAPELADGVLFMPLAGVTDLHLLPATVAAALDLRDVGDRSPTDQVVAALRDRDLLLVLDTFERLLPGAGFVADLVTRCPRLSVLVTSRSRLNLSAERVFLVQPLAVPNDGSGTPANTTPLVADRPGLPASVQLFVERARAAASGFALTAENMSAVNEICRRLDGLPLAIELAAVWIRIMPPAALLERLQQRLDLLTGGAIDLPPRLRSLREAIAWSHDLLAPDQQALFRRLSVFHGGFALDAAAHIAPDIEPSRVLPLVSALVDQSLLVKDEESPTAGSARFAMLDTIREFAHERLTACGEAEDAAARHAAWFLALAERAEPELQGPAQRAWLDRLDGEIDNLRAALAWLLARGETLAALRFTGATDMFWLKRGRYAEGRTWVARALAADGSAEGKAADRQTAVHAKAHSAAGSLAFVQGDFAAAIASHEAALAAGRGAGATHEIARALNALGGLLVFSGRVAEGRSLLEEVLPLYEGLPDAFLHGMTLTQLGLALVQQDEAERALSMCAEAVVIQKAAGDWWGACVALTFLGLVALGTGDLSRASDAYAECTDLGWRNGETGLVAEPLFGLGAIAAFSGQPARAARLLGGATALAEAIGYGSFPMTQALVERAATQAKAALGPAAFASAWSAGRALSAADVVAEALGETAAEDLPIPFTPRERAVLRLLTEYRTDKEIGATLFISHRTAMWHVAQILRKLGVATRVEAADYAIRHGLV